jgi:hypothetical protein
MGKFLVGQKRQKRAEFLHRNRAEPEPHDCDAMTPIMQQLALRTRQLLLFTSLSQTLIWSIDLTQCHILRQSL